MRDPNCIFCKIVSKALPAVIIYEDENYLAFLDIHPVNPGHTLVIPKEHYQDFLNTPEELSCGTYIVIKKIVPAILSAVGVKDFNLGMNNGASAGQVIAHSHVHVIPRFSHDGHVMWRGSDYADGEMQAVGDKIRAQLNK